ncbi:MAG TPA: hypothetical protein PL105_13315 [Caldilineaceae bacterium]|nr:hypothetical protein [Caldilineaceae bacterium]
MARNDMRLIWGAVLVLLGFGFLMQNLGVFDLFGMIPETLWTIFWMGAFGCAGLFFLAGFWLNRVNWWMAIPGFVLLGLSATILVDEFIPGFPFSGSIFLGGVALGFIAVYATNREHWWAIIPGGVNLTLAVVAGLDEVSGWENGGIFFLGLAATFALVALTPTPKGRMNWAWIPAGILFALAIVTTASLDGIFGLLWPLALIVLGGGLPYRNYQRTRSEQE